MRVDVGDVVTDFSASSAADERQLSAPHFVPSASSPSQRHSGIGVPQKRLRLMAQSRASPSQLPKRFLPTDSGTQWMSWLCTAMRSLKASTFTNHTGTVL